MGGSYEWRAEGGGGVFVFVILHTWKGKLLEQSLKGIAV